MSTGSRKKPLLIVLGILLALILLAAGILTAFSFKNNKIIYDTAGEALGAVSDRFTVTELDPGEFSEMRMYGVMKFRVNQYEIEDVGNLSVMFANMGIMQMVSLIITPIGREMPLCSLDFMYILGKRKSYCEFFNLVPDKKAKSFRNTLDQLRMIGDRYADLADLEIGEAWYDDLVKVSNYKQLSSKQDDHNCAFFVDAVKTWAEVCEMAGSADGEFAAKQKANTEEYCDRLIMHGGVSTDFFKKNLGEEKTREFFDKVLFGTANYES